jgi:hypothetical protein
MQTAKRRQTTWAVTASVLAHLAVGLFLLSQKSTLPRPPDFAGPPEAIIPLLILPRTPPPQAGGKAAKPTPIRLHRRPQRFLPPETPTAPIAPPEPPAPAAAASAPRGPVALHPSPLPEGPKGEVRAALRAGTVGCANPTITGLNKAEREHCDEVFGKGAKDTAFAGLGLTAEKQRLLDAAAAKKEDDYRYKHGTVPNGGGPGGPLGADPRAAKVPF